MVKKEIYHFGSPFIDTRIKINPKISKTNVEKVNITSKFGGICNTINISRKLGFINHLIIAAENESNIKSYYRSNQKINFHVFKNHINTRAVIHDSFKSKEKKTYLSDDIKSSLNLNINTINNAVILVSYIEDFPINISQFLGCSNIIISDFNNSLIINRQNKKFISTVKQNLLKLNYLFFSNEEIRELLNFLNFFKWKENEILQISKINLISRSSSLIRIGKVNFNRSKISIKFNLDIKNKNIKKNLKTSIGNGDIFNILFAHQIQKKECIKDLIEVVQSLTNKYI